MANTNFVHFLEQKSRQRKIQEAGFYDSLDNFFQFQNKEEGEVVDLYCHGLVEQCDNNKLGKYSKMQNRDPTYYKSFWTTGYLVWSNVEFKE